MTEIQNREPETSPTGLTATREEWLRQAVAIFRPRFVEVGLPLPERVRVSVGFGSTGARQENAVVLGVCYARQCSADGVNEIFISPEDADTASILFTLLHELVHAADDNYSGHRGRFAEVATRLGMEGKMTSGHPGITLAAELMTIAETLGEWPGAAMKVPTHKSAPVPVGPDGRPVRVHSGAGVQTSRMLKHSCQEVGCEAYGYTVRMARTWVETWGAPTCPGSESGRPAERRAAAHRLTAS